MTEPVRAGISTFDLSRYMGASLTMIDRHYGHLAGDGRDHAINLLDAFTGSDAVNVHPRGHCVDVAIANRRPSRERNRLISRRKTDAL